MLLCHWIARARFVTKTSVDKSAFSPFFVLKSDKHLAIFKLLGEIVTNHARKLQPYDRRRDDVQYSLGVTPQAAQAHYVWFRAPEVIWSKYTRIITVLSDAK